MVALPSGYLGWILSADFEISRQAAYTCIFSEQKGSFVGLGDVRIRPP